MVSSSRCLSFPPHLRAEHLSPPLGDVNYLHILGQGLVFLNSPEAVFDLLDKRGSIYSDKPHMMMVGELCVHLNLAGRSN